MDNLSTENKELNVYLYILPVNLIYGRKILCFALQSLHVMRGGGEGSSLTIMYYWGSYYLEGKINNLEGEGLFRYTFPL